MKKFIKDFKDFAMKGNVMDMAIGVVIGGAFGKIVTSLVTDIISPIIGLLTGGVTLSNLKYVFSEAVLDEAGNVVTPESALTYGAFLQNIIDFFIIALAIFIVIRIIGSIRTKLESAKKKEEEAAVEEEKKPEPSEVTNELLTEILAELKKEGK